jgi:hypothetical protein
MNALITNIVLILAMIGAGACSEDTSSKLLADTGPARDAHSRVDAVSGDGSQLADGSTKDVAQAKDNAAVVDASPAKDGTASKDATGTKDSGGNKDTSLPSDSQQADLAATPCAKHSGGAGIGAQSLVQVEAQVCAGTNVAPKFGASDYPCDAPLPASDVRKAFQAASKIKFLAADWASAGCALSTLCGQQYDQGKILAHDPSFASFLTPAQAGNLPGIDIASSTTATDVLQSSFNCLANFPNSGGVNVAAFMPVDDTRTGEVLLFTKEGGVDKFYRGRVQVILDAKKATSTNLTGFVLQNCDGKAIADGQSLFTELANGTGSIVQTKLQLGTGADVAVEVTLRIECLRLDQDIK